MTTAALKTAHQSFVSQLPKIDRTLSYQFRHQPTRRRAAVIADARGAVWHAWLGLVRLSLHDRGRRGAGRDPEAWAAWEVVDNRVSPADQAAFKLDYEAWLSRLPVRKRRVAELLAAGETTGEVARLLGVTAGAISQARRSLEADWRAFQGEDDGQGARVRTRPAAVGKLPTRRAG
jgi:hypothetical protein